MSLPYISGQRRKYLLLLLLVSTSVFIILLFKYQTSFQQDSGLNQRIQLPKDYTWLPAVFIYKDLRRLKWFDPINEKFDLGNPDEYFYEDKSKLRLLRFSPGNSLIYLPPFIIGHIWCLINNIEPSGYSAPYLFSLVFWKIILLTMGLIFSYIFLTRFFTPFTAFISVVVFLFTTPLLDGPLAESWFPYQQFFLTSVFLASIDSFWKKTTKLNTILLGFSLFMLIGIDLNNVVFIAFILFWFLSPKPYHVKSKIFHIIKNYKYYAILVFAILCSLFIHLAYTRHVLESYGFYNYDGRIFGYLWSNLIESWINIGYGMIIYSPILLLIIPGIFFLYRYHKRLFYFALFSIIVYQLVINSSNISSFSKDFGNNYIMTIYPLMMVPFAALIEKIWNHLVGFIIFILFSLSCGYYTNWLIYHKQNSTFIPSNEMTVDYFLNVVGRDDLSRENIKLLDTEIIYNKPISDSLMLIKDRLQYCLNKKIQYTRRWESQVESDRYKYVRFKLEAYHETNLAEVWNYAQMLISMYENDNNVKNEMIRVQRFTVNNEWTSVWIDALIPKNVNKISASIWNAENKERICFRRIEVYVY